MFKLIKSEESMKTYVRRLVYNKEAKLIGRGAFSAVFEHPKNEKIAVKVVRGTDKAFIKYAKWIQKNQDNKYLPKIFNAYKIKNEKEDYYIFFMEKLVEYKSELIAVNNFLKFAPSISDKKKEILDSIYSKNPSNFLKMFLKSKEFKNQKDLKDLFSFLALKPDWFDFHSGNVMKKNNQMIFTDPMACENPDDYVAHWF